MTLLESSITILEASFTHIHEVYSTGVTYNNRHSLINWWSLMFLVEDTGVN